MRFDVLTIFPEFFSGPFNYGVLNRARRQGLVEIATHDLRGFAHDRHRTVDDRPFGGGEGMVLKPEPISECVQSLGIAPLTSRNTKAETVICLSAQGVPLTQNIAQQLASTSRVVLICGRYEGVDERVNEMFCDRELSIGDYVLSGGELAAAVIIDTVVRLLPGVLGNPNSTRHESFGADDPGAKYISGSVPPSTYGSGGLLDYPQYTRPADFDGVLVPEVLQHGDHLAIRRWRRERALQKTLQNRPELLERASLTADDLRCLRVLGYECPSK